MGYAIYRVEMKNIKVILLDNEAIILSGQNYLLACACNYVKTALCGKAIEIAETEITALVINDLIIPNVNGIEVCRNIKARYPNIEAVLVSGSHDEIRKYLLDILHTEYVDISDTPLFKEEINGVIEKKIL